MSFKPTFKEYLAEQDMRKQIVLVAQKLLGAPVVKTDRIKEKDIETAKELKHEFVPSAAGPWIVNVFKAIWGEFVRIDPPLGIDYQKTFYVPATVKEENKNVT